MDRERIENILNDEAHNAIRRGFREASALGIILKHIGVKGILGSSLVLLATSKKKNHLYYMCK